MYLVNTNTYRYKFGLLYHRFRHLLKLGLIFKEDETAHYLQYCHTSTEKSRFQRDSVLARFQPEDIFSWEILKVYNTGELIKAKYRSHKKFIS